MMLLSRHEACVGCQRRTRFSMRKWNAGEGQPVDLHTLRDTLTLRANDHDPFAGFVP